MKKILLWHRGPVRPNVENCINNMNLLRSCFSTEFFHIEELISTYRHFLAENLFNLYKTNYFLMMDAPDSDFIKNILSKSHLPAGAEMHRVFKQFYTNKIVSSFIFDLQKYDFIIMSRMDTSFSIKETCFEWFNDKKYTTIHDLDDGWTNDQFGIADPKIMKNAWDFFDFKKLQSFASNAYRAEDIFDQIIKMNNIETFSMKRLKNIMPDLWIQDPDRGSVVV